MPRDRDPPVDFDEAIAFFRARVPMPPEQWEALEQAARERAFKVAGVAQLDVLNSVWLALDDAIARGATIEEFRELVEPTLTEAWQGTVANPGARVECLPGETAVDGAVVRAVHRRWYQGTMIEVVTCDGRQFTATPNHPMLTRRGWVGAGRLREGDDLVGHRRQQDLRPGRDEHVAAAPATIEQLFRAVAVSGAVERVLGRDHDFHGDGRDGDVDIARPGRMLQIGRFAALTKPLGHRLFAGSDLARSGFCRLCDHLHVVSERCGFCDSPVPRPGFLQALTDRAVRGFEALGEVVGALARSVALNQLLGWQVVADPGGLAAALEVQGARRAQAACDPGSPNERRDAATRAPDFVGDPPAAEAGSIEFDRVVSLRRRQFSGHVFNLSTVCGYFTINGLYTGNTIFRTNVQSAYNAGAYQQRNDPAVRKRRPFWQFRAIQDARTSDLCRPLDGIVRPADDPWWKTHTPPLHHQCFVPGTIVQGAFIGGLRARYAGQVVEIETVARRRLTVTPNHPVLTVRGFVAAHALHEGDDIIAYGCHVDPRAMTATDVELKHEQNEPAAVEQVFGSLRQRGRLATCNLRPLDLHGDAVTVKGDVEIVGSYVELLAHAQASETQRRRQGVLVVPALADAFVHGARAGEFRFQGVDPATRCLPRRSELTLDGGWIRAESLPLDAFRIGPAAEMNASRYEVGAESAARDAAFAGELLKRYPGLVALDQVRQVRQFEFCGHVYDLETVGGWIVASGIVTSNCRSQVVPLTDQEAREEGIAEAAPDVAPAEGFGAAPSRDEGAPDWEPDLTRYPEPLREVAKKRLAG